jgi:hypothetical protein
MRNLLIVVMVVLTFGAGFWFGQRHANRGDVSTARPSVSGNINVIADGNPPQVGTAVLSNSLAVDGDLRMRSLPNGRVELEGNLNVRPN